MRAFSRVGGKVRISLPDKFETEHMADPVRWSVIVGRGEYEELRDQVLEGDPVRAELKRDLDAATDRAAQAEAARDELKASLDDALSAIERLSDERDEWKDRAERGEAALARYPQPLWDPETLRRSLLTESARDDVDELKAVIVSQAREIARLKEESE